jgi:TonB family protein
MSTLPTDPTALLQVAAPFYDYFAPDMKPWHARYRFQYFDENGQPGAVGEFDYSWSTTKATRRSWTQGAQTRISWHTADGKEMQSSVGDNVPSLEYRLSVELVPAFLKMKDLNDRQLKFFTIQLSSQNLDCVASVTAANVDRKLASLDDASPTYCFKEHEPILVSSHENGTIKTVYGEAQKFQNRNFPTQMQIFYASTKRVEANLEDLDELPANDPSFTPSADAKEFLQNSTRIVAQDIQMPIPIRRVPPVYPMAARGANITGKVILQAIIGKDGWVKDVKIVSSPNALLSGAALDAVHQWRYNPVMIGGKPAEVPTTITIPFGK